MTFLKRCLWAAAAAVLLAGGASAQITGGNTGGTTGGGLNGGGNSGLSGGSGFSNSSNLNQNAALTTNAQDSITKTGGGFSQSVIQPSNIIGPYFANPAFQGVPSSGSTGVSVTGPGGFGSPLFSGTGTAAGGTGGRSTGTTARAGSGTTAGGSRTSTSLGNTGLTGSTLGGTTSGLGGSVSGLGGTSGAGGRTTGLGGTSTGLGGTGGRAGGTGGFSGTGGTGGFGTTNSYGLTVNRAVAYTQELKFASAPVPAPQLQADVRAALAGSSSFGGARVAASVDGSTVILRGSVADDDEARLVEGVVRLTPGVKDVKNELDYPNKPKTP